MTKIIKLQRKSKKDWKIATVNIATNGYIINGRGAGTCAYDVQS